MTSTLEAAVAIVMRPPHPHEILVVRRAESPTDPWSGDIALPGGKRDLADRDLAATAARETLEETGIRLSLANMIAELEPEAPASTHLPQLRVTPFVFEVGEGSCARPTSTEVASVHWIPFKALVDPGMQSTYIVRSARVSPRDSGDPVTPREHGSSTPHLRYPCYKIGDLVIWGLTYRILSRFVSRCLGGDVTPA